MLFNRDELSQVKQKHCTYERVRVGVLLFYIMTNYDSNLKGGSEETSSVICSGTSGEELEAEVCREMLEVVLCFLGFGPIIPRMRTRNEKRKKFKLCSNH